MTTSAASSASPRPDFDVTLTDEHGITHAWALVHTMPGEAVTMCGWNIPNAYTLEETNDFPMAVSCLHCIANEHRYQPVPRRMIRLRGER